MSANIQAQAQGNVAVLPPVQANYSIGTRYQPVGKDYVCTVTDILSTFNSKGDLVRIRYVATHTFMFRTITDYDVIETTIARGKR
jgi:hypothetical protein